MQYCQVSTLVGDDLRTIRINNVTRVFLDLTIISSCALGNGTVTFFVVAVCLCWYSCPSNACCWRNSLYYVCWDWVGKVGQMLIAFGLKKQIDDSLLLLPCSNAWKSCRCFYSRTRTCSAFLWYAYINETSVKCPVICSWKFHASFVSGTLLGIFLDRSLCSFRCVDRCFFAAWKEFLEQWRFYSTAKDNSFQFWHSWKECHPVNATLPPAHT